MESYVGEIRIFAGNYTPEGWHDCDGSLLSIQGYPQLALLLGTTYGGDGATTFALPDMRGRLPIGCGSNPNRANISLGDKVGTPNYTLASTELPPHTHNSGSEKPTAKAIIMASQDGADISIPQDMYLTKTGGYNMYRIMPSNNDYARTLTLKGNNDITTPMSGGGGQPHNNDQPYMCLRFIISLSGIYPSF